MGDDAGRHPPVAIVFTGLVLVILLAALDSTIVATALPTIVGDLGGLQHISWITSAYLLAQTAVTPLYGKLGDLYGRKRILQSAVVLFLAGSALCGLARSMTALIGFRAVQGLGAGGLIVLTQATVGDIVAPRERGRYQGIFGGVFGLASVAGPLLGRDRGRGARRLLARRAAGARAGAPAGAVARARVLGRGQPFADRRLRAVRRGHVPAAVLPDGRRRVADVVRAAAAADDARGADDFDRVRAGDLPPRPLRGVPRRGDGGDGARTAAAVAAHRLTDQLTGGGLPAALQRIVAGGGRLTVAQVGAMPSAARVAYQQAYVHALTPVFTVAAVVALVGFPVSWLLPERPLKATAATSTGLEDGLGAPKSADSLAEIERALARATTLVERRRFGARVAERAGADVSPGATWALVRIGEHGFDGARTAAVRQGVTEERIAEVLAELRAGELIDGGGLTPRGSAFSDQLLSARRDLLCELLADPAAEREPEVARLLRTLSRELVGERP
jgi:hypothetical protein